MSDDKPISINWDAMQNLAEFTLVVPTYNRQRYVLNQMHFWSDAPVTLHVLDGTGESINKKKLKGLGKNGHYHHMPNMMQTRMREAINFIDTECVSLLCDDEFHIPSSLDHNIETLKEKKEFIACMGRCLGFNYLNSGIIAKPMYVEMKVYRIEQEIAGNE